MPELPEVETVKNDLRPLLRGRRFLDVIVWLPKLVKMPAKKFVRLLKHCRILEVKRRAKILLIELDSGDTLLIHLKMSGQLVCVLHRRLKQAGGHPIAGGIEGLPNKYTHVIFRLSGNCSLYFNDLRQFGYLLLWPTKGLPKFFAARKLGHEPFDRTLSFEDFTKILRSRRNSTIKAVLLDQSIFAGIGNIYADEILFAAGVRPTRRGRTLRLAEKRAIFVNVPKILRLAVLKRGTTYRMYRDGLGLQGNMLKYLRVYRRAGRLCIRCKKGKIQKIRQGSRGSHYCPVCQR